MYDEQPKDDLQGGEQVKPDPATEAASAQDAPPRRCPKDLGFMVECTFDINEAGVFRGKAPISVTGMMCDRCGYTEFYAPTPEEMILASKRSKLKWWEQLAPENWP